jgi:hypothetical protein
VCAEGEEEGWWEGRPCLDEGIASCAGEEGHGRYVGGGGGGLPGNWAMLLLLLLLV